MVHHQEADEEGDTVGAKPQGSEGILSFPRLRGLNRCFVCGKPHSPKVKHTREELIVAVANLKVKYPTALFMASDLAYITQDCTDHNEEDSHDPQAEWRHDPR